MINVIFNKNIPDGWYTIQGLEGIEHDGYRIDIPFKIESKIGSPLNDYNEENSVNLIMINEIHQKNAKENVCQLLSYLDLWEKITFRFPNKNESVFDFNVARWLKVNVPGNFCAIRVSHDDLGFNRITAIAKKNKAVLLSNVNY